MSLIVLVGINIQRFFIYLSVPEVFDGSAQD